MDFKTNEANHFELGCGKIGVTYSSTSITGEPLLNYRDQHINKSFSGDGIEFGKTSIGQLVTVTLEHVPDQHIVRFSLILPMVKVVPGSPGTPVTVPGLRTTLHTTLIGPPVGPDKSYEVHDLAGTAHFVMA